jgi:hypothetical protein
LDGPPVRHPHCPLYLTMSRSLGILPDRYLGILDVPGSIAVRNFPLIYIGTVLFYQESTNDPDSEPAENSHGPELIKTKDGIVLSPQPHEDPNDPLVLNKKWQWLTNRTGQFGDVI